MYDGGEVWGCCKGNGVNVFFYVNVFFMQVILISVDIKWCEWFSMDWR